MQKLDPTLEKILFISGQPNLACDSQIVIQQCNGNVQDALHIQVAKERKGKALPSLKPGNYKIDLEAAYLNDR